MVFDSEDTRDEYFKRIEHDINAVEYGDAVRQASATCLGFWGSEEVLFYDCSRIMLAEIRKHIGELFCALCDVQLSSIWHTIYESARAKPRREMAATYTELGIANNNEDLLQEAENLKTTVYLGDTPPYQIVYNDIKRRGTVLDGIYRNPPRRT